MQALGIIERSRGVQEIFQGTIDRFQGREVIQEKIEEEVVQGKMIEGMIKGVCQEIKVRKYTRDVLHVDVKLV